MLRAVVGKFRKETAHRGRFMKRVGSHESIHQCGGSALGKSPHADLWSMVRELLQVQARLVHHLRGVIEKLMHRLLLPGSVWPPAPEPFTGIYVEIIKKALSGEKIDFNGKIFSLKNFSLLIKPPRKNIPIYLAAINQKMVELCWQIADGVIFYLRPLSELENTIKQMQSRREIDVSCQLITCMSNDVDKAIECTKKTLAFYISVGEIYRKFLAKNGFENETKNVYEEYQKSGLKSNYELVPESMLEKLCVYGTPDECIKRLKQFHKIGVNLPIIQFNPIGNVAESFNLLTSTFSKIENE